MSRSSVLTQAGAITKASRISPRSKIFRRGSWSDVTGGREHVLHLLDISAYGARGYTDEPPLVGTYVQLFCARSLGNAQVRWVSGKVFGLRLVTYQAPEVMADILG